MEFDDRIATVLKQRSDSPETARVQYRQLLDLLGQERRHRAPRSFAAGLARLHALLALVDPAERAAAVEGLGAGLRSPVLLRYLSADEPRVAATALRLARLDDSDWVELIPELTVRARGALRHRRDLGPGARRMLAAMGGEDMALPLPDHDGRPDLVAAPQDVNGDPDSRGRTGESAAPGPADSGSATGDIGQIVRRIEAFRRTREQAGSDAPMRAATAPDEAPHSVVALLDANGIVRTVSDARAAPLVGVPLAGLAETGSLLADRLSDRLAFDHSVRLAGPPLLQGDWLATASPRFDLDTGAFQGHAIKLVRQDARVATPATAPGSDGGLRQVVHELRTPLNAIAGFAELIGSQLFGPVSAEYRSMAERIEADARNVGNDLQDLQRLLQPVQSSRASLPAGALAELIAQARSGGPAPVVAVADETLAQQRVAADPEGVERLLDRIVRLLADAARPDEMLTASIVSGETAVRLDFSLPQALRAPTGGAAECGDGTARDAAAFSLRLASGLAAMSGGTLELHAGLLSLTLPVEVPSAVYTAAAAAI